MTGQVDEAGRKDRWIAALYPHGSEYPPRVERAMAEADREAAGLRTRNEELERVYVLASDRADRLAGQVAAIRAVPRASFDEAAKLGADWANGFNYAIDTVRAALVASSPTTPEAKK